MRSSQVSTPADNSVQVTRDFDASTKLVWRAYTQPELLTRWCLGPPGWSMPVCEMDVRPGGQYRWRWRDDQDGTQFGLVGEFKEVIRETRMVQTQSHDAGDTADSMGEQPSIVTIDFQESEGIAHVVTTIEFASQEDRDAALATGMTDGMEMSYQQLDKVLSELG